jgi:hypothetical protein
MAALNLCLSNLFVAIVITNSTLLADLAFHGDINSTDIVWPQLDYNIKIVLARKSK